jgi:glucose dehydrogenase
MSDRNAVRQRYAYAAENVAGASEDMAKYKVSTDEVPGFMGTVRPQIAGPYGGVRIDILQSALGIPCNTPPFGTMSAIDLNTRQLMWQVPMGSVEDTGPLGLKTTCISRWVCRRWAARPRPLPG